MAERQLILGIDGGGTSTTAWLAWEDDLKNPIGKGKTGPSNIRSVGVEVGLKNLDLGVQAAFDAAGITRATVTAAVLGLAGADREGDRKTIEEWAHGVRLADRVKVVNDAIPILYASDSSGVGVALIVGTGSFAFGRRADGCTIRSGGWGHLLGDEGSGYQIALSGLRAAARSADGREAKTELLPEFLRAFGCAEPMGLVTSIYRPEMDRTRIAELAVVVFDVARNGDPAAIRIIQEAAGELVAMITAVARQLGLTEVPFALGLTGGVILNHLELRDQLTGQLQRTGLKIDSIRPIADPVAGALIIARQLLGFSL